MSDPVVIFRGDSAELVVTVRDKAGNVVDLTGASIEWELADDIIAPALLTTSSGAGLAVTDAAGGIFTVTLAPAETAALTRGAKYQEAKMTDAGGRVGRVVAEQLTITDTRLR